MLKDQRNREIFRTIVKVYEQVNDRIGNAVTGGGRIRHDNVQSECQAVYVDKFSYNSAPPQVSTTDVTISLSLVL